MDATDVSAATDDDNSSGHEGTSANGEASPAANHDHGDNDTGFSDDYYDGSQDGGDGEDFALSGDHINNWFSGPLFSPFEKRLMMDNPGVNPATCGCLQGAATFQEWDQVVATDMMMAIAEDLYRTNPETDQFTVGAVLAKLRRVLYDLGDNGMADRYKQGHWMDTLLFKHFQLANSEQDTQMVIDETKAEKMEAEEDAPNCACGRMGYVRSELAAKRFQFQEEMARLTLLLIQRGA